MGHVKDPFYLDGYNFNKYQGYVFEQSINRAIIDSIIELYSNTYGKPIIKDTSMQPLLIFGDLPKEKGLRIEEDIIPSRTIQWETPYLTIILYEGIKGLNKYSNGHYSFDSPTPSEKSTPTIQNEQATSIECYDYSYIKYSIKSETLKKLEHEISGL